MITSLTSPKISRVRRLLETHTPKERQELGQFVIEGLRGVRTAHEAAKAKVVEVFATEKWIDEFPDATLISDQVAQKVSETVSTQGIFAVVDLPEVTEDLHWAERVALFLELQDPGNAGTIIRNAHAFAIDAIVFSAGSVDPFSGKVVRASVGSIVSVPTYTGIDTKKLLNTLSETHQIVAFDMVGEEMSSFERGAPILMIFGNEARGLPEWIREDAQIKKLQIPMPGGSESLNVASAAAIAMYQISQQP